MIKALLLIIISNLVFAGTTIINENPLQISKSFFLQKNVEMGSEVELLLEVKLAPNHHAYVKQFKIKPQNNKDIQIKPLLIKPTVKFYDNLAKKNKMGIENEATIKTSFEVPSQLKTGENDLHFFLQYQACTKEYCLLPIDLPFNLSLKVKGKVPAPAQASGLLGLKSMDLSGKSTNIFIILLIIFAAGVVTSFTPCIYPMIPITLAVLGSSKTESTISRRFFLSLSYVFGIALTYSLLGVLAATTGEIFGSYLAHPGVVTGIAVLFTLMALSMFGLFEIQAPAFIRNKFATKQFRQNYWGAFFTGTVAGVIASPCVGPVLVVILAFISTSKNIGLGFLYMFVFAMGLGLIFIALGVFSQSLKALPKSGAWMNITKFVFGGLMLGMAAYYLKPAVSALVFYLFVLFCLTISFYYCFKLIQNFSFKIIVCLFLLTGATASIFQLFSGGQTTQKNSAVKKQAFAPEWKIYSDKLLLEAKQKNKGVIIDFYADWCAACHELEEKTFSTASVNKIGQNFYWLKYDATDTNEVFDKLKDRYEIFGLPHIVIYGPDGTYLKSLTLTGFEEEAEFAKRLTKALAP